MIETTHITSIGNTLYSNLFILLIVTSFILLLAMVGTIVITVKDKIPSLRIYQTPRKPYRFVNMPLESSSAYSLLLFSFVVCLMNIHYK